MNPNSHDKIDNTSKPVGDPDRQLTQLVVRTAGVGISADSSPSTPSLPPMAQQTWKVISEHATVMTTVREEKEYQC